MKANAFEDGRHRRIRHKTPVQMPRVTEKLELVAMKAVAAVGKQMQQGDGGGDSRQSQSISAAAGGIPRGAVWQIQAFHSVIPP
jgi:hypothetical protein